MDRDIDKR